MDIYEFPPKRINYFFGYRTPAALKSRKRWDFAQKKSCSMLISSGIALVVISLAGLFIDPPERVATTPGILILVAIIFHFIYKVERALKKNFG